MDSALFKTLMNSLLLSPVDIANEIAPNDSGVDSSRDWSRMDCVLFETLINSLLLSG